MTALMRRSLEASIGSTDESGYYERRLQDHAVDLLGDRLGVHRLFDRDRSYFAE